MKRIIMVFLFYIFPRSLYSILPSFQLMSLNRAHKSSISIAFFPYIINCPHLFCWFLFIGTLVSVFICKYGALSND